jgi:hypothetical protein
MAIRVDPSKLGHLEAQLQHRLVAIKSRAALSAAQRSVALMQQRTRQAPPANPSGIGQGGAVNTGNYLRRWRAMRQANGASVYNPTPYAGVIELGRRPGSRMPPVGIIARWIQRRLSVSIEVARQSAFIIARAIAERGLLGRRVMTHPTALRKMAKFFQDEFTKELDRELMKLAREESL